MSDGANRFEFPGFCCTCDNTTRFTSAHEWFRDHLLCEFCGSIPRERALMHVVETLFPNWRELDIHESSPTPRGASIKFSKAAGYLASQYFPELELGARAPGGILNQDLEHQTFGDEIFDLVITQDVMEHIFDIDLAFMEISRTLKPGGAHVFTTPLVNKAAPTEQRARRETDSSITYLAEPEFHGNPVDPGGSLVTWQFGFDLARRIQEVSSLPTIIFHIDRIDLGIRAEYVEVLASIKDTTTAGRE